MEAVLNTISASAGVKPRMTAETLDALYRAYYKNVYNYICFRINNHFDAEDLACAVFEKALGARFNPDTPGEAWLITIAKNVVTDYFRARGRRSFVALETIFGLASEKKQPDEVVVQDEQNRALIAAMSRISDRERQILSLKFATDLKHDEIAKIMHTSSSNVGVIVHRALKKLKNFLEEDEHGQ
ncbi:MAG: sigma-70 family RNA polymerase sigma factor [Defluviitaleaceae bacterium]|nr:sigma-70 family RNA polymerase sigma factor [Defluviitaleaceae bacterium]